MDYGKELEWALHIWIKDTGDGCPESSTISCPLYQSLAQCWNTSPIPMAMEGDPGRVACVLNRRLFGGDVDLWGLASAICWRWITEDEAMVSSFYMFLKIRVLEWCTTECNNLTLKTTNQNHCRFWNKMFINIVRWVCQYEWENSSTKISARMFTLLKIF